MENDWCAVSFDSAGYISGVTHGEKEFCASVTKHIRSSGRKCRCMPYDKFMELQQKEMIERYGYMFRKGVYNG